MKNLFPLETSLVTVRYRRLGPKGQSRDTCKTRLINKPPTRPPDRRRDIRLFVVGTRDGGPTVLVPGEGVHTVDFCRGL